MKRFQKKMIIICFVVTAIVGGLSAFLFMGQIAFRFEHLVRVFVIAAVPEDSDELSIWLNWRELPDGDELEYNETIELWLLADSFFSQNEHVFWWTLYREGEIIRVVYISITETPITAIRRAYFHTQLRTQSRYVRTNAFQDMGYPQQRIEVYYLQNLHRLRRRIDRLSDEDFDALRAEASFVWRGTQLQ